MKKVLCAAVVVGLAIAPPQARADGLGAIIAGGVVGGLIGSVYMSGVAATTSAVSSGLTSAAVAVPAAATGAIAATSTPVLIGVVGGAAVAYLLYDLSH